MIQPIRKLMTLLILLMCSIGVWAQDGPSIADPKFYLENKLGDNATVAFYPYDPRELNTRAATATASVIDENELKDYISKIEAPGSTISSTDRMVKWCPYVLMYIVPKDDYWTDKALLFGTFATDESLVQPSIIGPVQPGYSTRAGITIGDKLEVNPIQIQLYADRFDGAGWYYMSVPEEASDGSFGNTIILNGFVVPKFDLNTVTSTSTDGKNLTYTSDGFTTTFSIDDGGTSFTYNGSAQGPTEITNSTIEVTRDSKTYTFETVGNHVQGKLCAQEGSNLTTDGKAVNVGSYSFTLSPKTRTVQGDGTTGDATTVPAGIFKNEKGINFTIKVKDMNTNPTGNEHKMTITVNPSSFVYNGTKQVPEVKVYDGEGDNAREIPDSEYDVSYKYKSNGTAVKDPTNAAEYTIVISNKANKTNGNYNIVGGTAEFTITPKEVGLTWNNTSFVYNGQAQQPYATVTGVEKVNNPDESCKVTTYLLAAKSGSSLTSNKEAVNVGNYTATATALDNSNYKLPSESSKDFEITAKGESSLSISMTPESSEYNGSEQEPAITVKDGDTPLTRDGDYTVSYVNSKSSSVSKPKDADTYTVTIASKSGSNYSFSTTKTYTITPKEVGLTWDKTSFVYNGQAQQPYATVTGVEKVNNPDESCKVTTYLLAAKSGSSLTSNKEAVNVGNYTATATALDNANYKLPSEASKDFEIIAKEDVSLSISMTPESSEYNGSEQEPAVTVKDGDTPLTRDGDYTVSYVNSKSSSVSKPKDADTYTVTIASKSGSNYSFSTMKTYTITPKEVGLTWSTPTTFTYNGSAQGVTATATGLITGDECTVTVSDGSKTNASTTPYTATATGLTNTNYKLPTTGLTQDFTIGPKTLTIAAENKSKVAGATDPTLTYTKDGLLDADANVITGGLKREEGEDVGTYAINQGDLAAGTNYTISFTGASFTIEAASFVEGDVTASGYEGTYDGKEHGIEVKAEGTTIKYGTKEGTYDETPLTYTNVGTYTIYYEVTKANYNPVTGSETVKITAKELTATVTAENKEYDATTSATVSGTVATGIEGETLTISGLTGTFADANVGTGKTVTIDGGEVSAGDNTTASNYSVSIPKSTTADITAKALTITAKDQSVTYGTNIATGTTQVTLSPATLPGNDQLTGISLTPSTTDVTTSGTITPSKAEIKSGEADVTSNYNISYLSGKLTITSATFVDGDVTAEAYSGVYDGKAHTIKVTAPEDATVRYGTAKGSCNLDKAPTYTDVSTNTVYFVVTRPNYNPVKGSQTVTITKKELTITAEAKSKIYGAVDPTLTYKVEGLVEGESLDGALTRDEGKDVGEYDILQGTLKATDNYKVTYIGAKLSITRAPLTVKADPKTKEAGEDDPALTYTYDKLVADDTEEVFSGSLTRIAGEEAGEYAIMLGNLSAGDNYDITFQGANLTITAKEPVKPEEPLYKIYVAESVGGEVHTTHTQAKQGQQVNIIIKTEDNYNLESLVVLNNSTRKPITTDVTTDKDNNEFTYFLMPGADVTVAATFVKLKEEFKQNIFILKNYYGEVVSNLLYAEPGQQVNLETRVKDGYTNVLLDELYVFNEKGEQLQLFYLDDPIEKVPVYLFFMKGERAYVYNSFKGTNGITDETKSLKLDGIKLFSLSDLYSNFLKTSGGTEGAELVLSFLANILANFTSDGALHVNQGPEDMCSALMNLQSGWKVKFDFTGIIQLINPELLGMSEGTINLTSGQIYELLSPGNLKLLMKSSESPLLINSITVIPPDSQDPTDPTDPSNPTDPTDPTAIKGMQADKAAGDIFDLRGRKVDENTLQKGVYIRNGRKIVIK